MGSLTCVSPWHNGQCPASGLHNFIIVTVCVLWSTDVCRFSRRLGGGTSGFPLIQTIHYSNTYSATVFAVRFWCWPIFQKTSFTRMGHGTSNFLLTVVNLVCVDFPEQPWTWGNSDSVIFSPCGVGRFSKRPPLTTVGDDTSNCLPHPNGIIISYTYTIV